MNREKLKSLFPKASEAVLDLNADSGASAPIMEHGSSVGPLAKKKSKDRNPERHVVRVTSYRIRLCDEDNLCEKYHVDSCRYAGLLPSDAPDKTHIVVGQKKVKKKTQEKTLIEIS